MKVVIEQIRITNFGKLKDFTLDLKDGFNLIYGKNEAGKSTIQLFIKAMLYGMPTRKRADETLKERERAIPWDGSKAGGVLKLSLGGRSIEIHRQFGKTAAGDKFEVCDAKSGEVLNEYTADNLGEKLFGVSAEVFERTLFIRQSKISTNGRCDELTGRLMNLKSTGDEGVSAESAIETIEKEKRSLKAKDKRSAKGRIDELSDKIEELKREKYDLLTQLTQTDATQKRIAELKAEMAETNEKIDICADAFNKSIEFEKNAAKRERLKRIDECNEKIKSLSQNPDFEKGKGLTTDIIKDVQTTEKKLFEAENKMLKELDFSAAEKELKREKTLAGVFFAIGVFWAIAAIVMCLLARVFAFLASAIIGMVFIVLGVKTLNAAKNKKQQINNIKYENEKMMNVKADEIAELKSALSNAFEHFGVSDSEGLFRIYTSFLGIKEQIESLSKAKEGFLGQDSYDDLKKGEVTEPAPDKTAAEIEVKLSALRSRQLELTAEIKSLESRMAYETKITKIPADIDTEIQALTEELELLKRRYLSCEKAQQIIKEAQDIWKAENMPQLNENVDMIIRKLTDDKYQSVKVLSDYRMRFSRDDNYYDAEYLSFGTYEQIYLALRLAMAKLICEGLPVFLDDILTSYDDERAKNAIMCLSDIKDKQIVLFTCHKSDAEFAEKTEAYTFNI